MHKSSYEDAVKNGVRLYKDKQSFDAYQIPCAKCGAMIKSWSYDEDKEYICKECRKEPLKEQFNELKSEMQLQNAIKFIKKYDKKLEKYGHGIDVITQNIKNGDIYKSKDEVIFAVILGNYNINFKNNEKIDKYEVDFMLCKEKLIIEIDGSMYHSRSREYKDHERDRSILDLLGREWRIIRIKDKYLHNNFDRLIDVIYNIYRNKLSASKVYLQ